MMNLVQVKNNGIKTPTRQNFSDQERPIQGDNEERNAVTPPYRGSTESVYHEERFKKHFFEIFFLQLLHNLSLSISHRLTWLERINLILLFYFSLIFHSWDSMHSFCRLAIYSSLWQYKRCTLTHMEFRPLISILSIEYWYILYIFIFIHL